MPINRLCINLVMQKLTTFFPIISIAYKDGFIYLLDFFLNYVQQKSQLGDYLIETELLIRLTFIIDATTRT